MKKNILFILSTLIFLLLSNSGIGNTTSRFKKLLQLKNSIFQGPNCYNSVLYLKNIMDHIRYVSEDEFRFQINRHCKLSRRGKYKEIKAGNLVLIYRPYIDSESEDEYENDGKFDEVDSEIVHTFIHIDKNIAFTKNGPSSFEKYKLSPSKEIFQFYDIPLGVKKGNDFFIEYYDCRNKEFSSLAKTEEEIIIEDIEKKIDHLIFNKIINFNRISLISNLKQIDKINKNVKGFVKTYFFARKYCL